MGTNNAYAYHKCKKSSQVSIQLMSPASGDRIRPKKAKLERSFHSINVPSEWGRLNLTLGRICQQHSFHSINVPSEWGRTVAKVGAGLVGGFHSINVPSEWGLKRNELELEQQELFPFN